MDEYACVRACVHAYAVLCGCASVRMRVCMYLCLHTCAYMCVCVCVREHTCVWSMSTGAENSGCLEGHKSPTQVPALLGVALGQELNFSESQSPSLP